MGALGIGSLLQGMGEGYDSQVKINTLQAKDKRERDAHGIAMQNAQLELGEKQKDIAYKDDLARNMADLAQQAKPIEVTDPATGQVTQRPGMDPLLLQQKAADTLKEVAFKYGKVNIEMLNQSMEFGKKVKGEGAMEAMRYAMTNPQDQEGIRKIFNEKGDVKLGKDVQVGVEQGMFGPTVVGFRVGANGQKQQVFDGFRDIIMPSMSPEAYAKTMTEFKTTEMKETGANTRTAIGEGGANNRAMIARETDLKKLQITNARKDVDDLNEMAKTRFTTLGRNAMAGLESDRRNVIEGEIMSRAEYLVREKGFNPNKALDAAQQMTFEAQGIDTKPLGLKPKK